MIHRRHALRQLGACISLPFLEATLPRGISASSCAFRRRRWVRSGAGGLTSPRPVPIPPRLESVAGLPSALCVLLGGGQNESGGAFPSKDQMRVATTMIGYTSCSYPEIGCLDGCHGYTRHNNKADKHLAVAKEARARAGHVACFLEKLIAIREADGSALLDNCLVHFGGGMGSWHESTELLDFKQASLANLCVIVLEAAGVLLKTFVDSKGPLSVG